MPDSFCSALYITASADNECRSYCSAAVDCSGKYTVDYQSVHTHTQHQKVRRRDFDLVCSAASPK